MQSFTNPAVYDARPAQFYSNPFDDDMSYLHQEAKAHALQDYNPSTRSISPLSSGSSSASSIPSPTKVQIDDHASEDEDEDAESDSDVEDLFLPRPQYQQDGNACYESQQSLPSFSMVPKVEPAPVPVAQQQFHFEGLSLSAQLPPSPAPRRRGVPMAELYASYASDHDADGESDGDASEDEYVPSPTLAPKKRHRAYESAPRPRSYTPASSSRSSDYAHAPFRPTKRVCPAPQSRNVQTAAYDVTAPSPSDPWACPHCPWVQHNKRTPDLKRHIRTHTRHAKPEQWVCCGVPFEQAAEFDVPPDAPPMQHRGQTMVGGCGKTFSRRDALKRHLDNDNIQCAGDLNAFPLCA